MSTFNRKVQGRAKLQPAGRTEKRLPIGQSMIVITGLSVFAWGVVVLFILAVRAIF